MTETLKVGDRVKWTSEYPSIPLNTVGTVYKVTPTYVWVKWDDARFKSHQEGGWYHRRVEKIDEPNWRELVKD